MISNNYFWYQKNAVWDTYFEHVKYGSNESKNKSNEKKRKDLCELIRHLWILESIKSSRFHFFLTKN